MINRKIRGEIDLLVAQRILTDDAAARLYERYPTGRWDLASLARWLTLLGAVTLGAGALIQCFRLEVWRTLLEAGLLGATVGLIALGRWLGRTRGLKKTQAALELLASFALQGLTVALAVHYSTGSDNWPALVGVAAALAMALAYALGNRLVLIHALVNLFTFFGGETGYVSGWGVYWLGMNYPARFLVAGGAALGVARAHSHLGREDWRSFTRVYLHFGLLVANLSLWFFSVFGWYHGEVRWSGTDGQRIAFSALWALSSVASLWASGRLGVATLRAYGLTFLVIDVYTFYFQFVVAHSIEMWFIHMLLVGGSLVFLALRVERRRRSSAA
jgi:hypothetical protein